jgi:hypothetical protein
MSSFGMTIEDPFYDEDGVLVDEDVEWNDNLDETTDEDVVTLIDEIYSPYYGA